MRRVTMIAAGALLAGLALAGCGSKQDSATSDDGGGGIKSLQLLAEELGANSSTKQSAHMAMTMEVAGQSIKADGDLKLGSSPAMDLTYDIPGIGAARMVLVDDAFYFELPKAAQKDGKPWVKLDPNGSDPLSKSLSAALKETKKNSDPAQMIKQLEGAGEITATKQENLEGKQTTHYSVTVDIRKYASKADPDLKSLLDKAVEAGVTTYPVEVWVDQESLPVRVTLATPFTNPQTQQQESVNMRLDYTDWGKPVTVTAPPADQVGPLPGR
jgi:hypothetical protein